MMMCKSTWGKLYNVSEISEAIVTKNLGLALQLFEEQSSFFAYPENANIELMGIYLNSLDRGIYNSLMKAFENSFDICTLYKYCQNNFQCAKNCDNYENFLKAGRCIIQNYFNALPCQNTHCQKCEGNAHVKKAQEYIKNNLSEPLTLEEVAENVFISKAYLSHLFKNCTGITFSDYVTSQRIDKAKLKLASTNESITEIALSCGFSQSSYFATSFKKATNQTPREFRASSKLQT